MAIATEHKTHAKLIFQQLPESPLESSVLFGSRGDDDGNDSLRLQHNPHS
jgi:hypothetical protein